MTFLRAWDEREKTMAEEIAIIIPNGYYLNVNHRMTKNKMFEFGINEVSSFRNESHGKNKILLISISPVHQELCENAEIRGYNGTK